VGTCLEARALASLEEGKLLIALYAKEAHPGRIAKLPLTKERIGQELRQYYQACASDELPTRLLTLIKKLDEESPED